MNKRSGDPWIDAAASIAHNKVLILDSATVINDSFNFTMSADTRNAENVVVIRSPEVAARYVWNWTARQAVARPFEAK